MMLLYLEIKERTRKYLEKDLKEEKIKRGVQVKPKAHNTLSLNLPQSSEAVCTKTHTQIAYGVQI
jgi:hypothetical protein